MSFRTALQFNRRRMMMAPALLALTIAACAKPVSTDAEQKLRALDQSYIDAWMLEDATGQESAVLALFDAEAAIFPSGGVDPQSGVSALKEFWFPTGAPQTLVSHFTHEIDDVDVSAGLGVVSGRYTLSFSVNGQAYAQRGNYLFVAKEQGANWRIKKMIWNDQPLTDV